MLDPRLLAALLSLLLPACGAATDAAPEPLPRSGGAAHMHDVGAEDDHDHPPSAPGSATPLVHRFQRAEDWAKEFDDPARDAWQRPADVIAALGLSPGMTVVDLGAGTGYFLPHLARAVGPKGRVLALDIEPDMVRYMKERAAREGLAGVEPRMVAVDDPGLPAGSVDRVLVVDTWHHIPNRAPYASKLASALAPGGAVVVVDFTKEAHRGPPPEHRLPPEQVVAELGAAGLAAAIVPAPLPEQYIVMGRRR
jgi:SAM-dependent methyltransferase